MRLLLFPVLCSLFACGDIRRTVGEGDPDFDPGAQGDTTDRPEVRVATWNVEELGAEGGPDYEAVAKVLRRLDADIVGLNEIDRVDARDLDALAAELGYATVLLPDDQPFGSLGNAVLSRFEAASLTAPSAAMLSGDNDAKDMTRLPVVLTVEVPGADVELTVVVQHWKSGPDPIDAFRRSVDGVRTAQAAALGSDSDLLVVMGDVNQEPEDSPGDPATFTSVPTGLPSSYSLGDDMRTLLGNGGIPHDPYGQLALQGVTPLAAAQRDGSAATRPVSGRRIDWIFVNDAVRDANPRTEIYDSLDEDLPGLADGGDPLGPGVSERASDHLPVMVSIVF